MDIKEIKITVPEGMEIDKKNSTFECIKFKRKEEPWRNKDSNRINGFYIEDACCTLKKVSCIIYDKYCYNIFATEKQAKSALAMAQISQIMANDERFGGVVTDEEWGNENKVKYIIDRYTNGIEIISSISTYFFLAFHTEEQRDLFLKENEDLIKQYLMID